MTGILGIDAPGFLRHTVGSDSGTVLLLRSKNPGNGHSFMSCMWWMM